MEPRAMAGGPAEPPASGRRSFLFLQGMASRFFGRLGKALAERGHPVHRINFNAGDRLFWPLPGADAFRAAPPRWPGFLEARLDAWHTTDIILFGDCRPLHRVAIEIAERRGIRVHVIEEGYLRPNWITVEEGGVNGNSAMPRDPEWFRRIARGLPRWQEGQPVVGSFRRRATEDVLYNFAMVLFAWRYPGYRTHRPWHPFVEYAGWLRRLARQRLTAPRRAAAGMHRLQTAGAPFYFFPLQLDCDTQIRHHSPYGRAEPAIEAVIGSFARHAPPESLLVVKEHPLDNGLRDWRPLVARAAAAAGVGERVIYLEGGDLEWLAAKAAGVVTVNSTAGVRALVHGVPLIALGRAIYDMPGLTFQGGLDAFWRALTAPDPHVFDAFRRVLVAGYLVNGGFFCEAGLELAVAGCVARLEAPAPRWIAPSPVVSEAPAAPIAAPVAALPVAAPPVVALPVVAPAVVAPAVVAPAVVAHLPVPPLPALAARRSGTARDRIAAPGL